MTQIKTYASVGFYDQNFINAQGWSIATMKAGIDKLHALGFTGIDFDVSVNFTDKGEITDPNYTTLIQLLDYCKDKNLDTTIHLQWVRGNDNAAYIGSYGNEISTLGNDVFFNSLNSYFARFGKIFQAAGVDALFLGGLGGSIAGSDLYNFWKVVISTARQDFKGNLTYQAYSPMKGVPEGDVDSVAIWNLLDAIGLSVKPYISEVPISNLEEILSGYYFSKLNYSSVLQQVEELFTTSDKPLYLQFNAFALDNSLDSGWDPTPIQLKAGKVVANYELQAKAFQVFLDIVKNHLGLDLDSTRSVNIFLANFGLGPDTTEWQHFGMSNFPEPATSVIKDGPLTTPNLLNLQSIKAGPADDVIYLGQHAQSVRLNGGHDQVFGSKSNNTIFVDPIVTFAEISGKISGWFDSMVTKFSLQVTSSNQLLGTFDVLNTSNLTDSKANWSKDQTFKVSLPVNTPPKDLELTLTSNNGTSFARLTDLNIYWLGETSINLSDGKNTGNFNSQLNTQNPNWIFSGGGKYFELKTSDFLNRNVGTSKVNGDSGIDSVVLPTERQNYNLTQIGNSFVIKEKNTYTPDLELRNIERLIFSNSYLAIDIAGNAGTAAKILGAVFGKNSVSNKNYVGIGLHFLDAGWTYDNLAGLALDAAGAKTNDQIVSLLWTNVIGTKPTAADKQPFIALLENGMTAGALAHLAADTSLNTVNINLVGLAQTGIEYIPVS
jgi:hypothetical protein